jgi:hypothetical protein
MADSANVTAFDKGHYEQLITYLRSLDDGVNTNPVALGTSGDLKLDNTLSSRLKAGSQSWEIAKNLAAQAGIFGNSVHARYTSFDEEMRAFVKALKDAEDVFENTNDLATMDAGKFAKDHPDIVGSPNATTPNVTTPGGGGSPNSGGSTPA